MNAVLSLGATTLLAQGKGGGKKEERPDPIEKARMLKPNLYMITGGGANTLVRVTPQGLIVVDTKNPGGDRGRRACFRTRAHRRRHDDLLPR